MCVGLCVCGENCGCVGLCVVQNFNSNSYTYKLYEQLKLITSIKKKKPRDVEPWNC